MEENRQTVSVSETAEDNFQKTANRVSFLTIIGNVVLAIVKLLAGIIAHSNAMISDAVHSASDVFSTIVVIIGIKLASKQADKEHPYGHERLECVAAIVLAMVLFITGLAAIPPSIYEAATVDGSSKWHTFWHITLPLLKPTVVLVSIMAMLQCLKTFSTQYMFVQNGAARQPIDVITMNIYFTGIRNGKLGRASAMSIILFVIMLLFTYLQFKVSKTDDVDY